MRVEWVFDKNLSERQVKKILSNPEDKRFVDIAAILFERNNDIKKVFTFIKKEDFVRHWMSIKKKMRTNNWNSLRIMYWQRIYRKLFEDFKRQGMEFRGRIQRKPIDELCADLGMKIKQARKKNKQTQSDLARAMNVSQQMVSQIENGYENISLLTLKRIAKSLKVKVKLEFGQ